LAVKIRLKRIGKKKQPFYRIVVMDNRVQRDGKTIDDIGFYQPWLKNKNSRIDMAKYADWIKKGALPSPTVRTIFKTLGKKSGASAPAAV
jgi:small subunit ribosomal protein S16